MILYTQIIKLNCECKVVMIFVIFEILSIQKKSGFPSIMNGPEFLSLLYYCYWLTLSPQTLTSTCSRACTLHVIVYSVGVCLLTAPDIAKYLVTYNLQLLEVFDRELNPESSLCR